MVDDLPPVEIGRTLTCTTCGSQFVFTNGEQEYFRLHGLDEPKRCKKCRELRKREGGVFGAKVIIVDCEIDLVLCSRCRKPANRGISEAKGSPTCSPCAGVGKDTGDHMSYDQWRHRKGKNPYAG